MSGAPSRSEEYLQLRRDGQAHADACQAVGLLPGEHSAMRYKRWWEAESGTADGYAEPACQFPRRRGRWPQ